MTELASKRAIGDRVRNSILLFMQRRPALKRKTWCKASGLSERTLSRFLNGHSDTMNHDSLKKLADNQGVSVGVLTGELPDPLDDEQSTTRDSKNALVSTVEQLTEDEVHNQQLMVQLLRQQIEQSSRLEDLLRQQGDRADQLLRQHSVRTEELLQQINDNLLNKSPNDDSDADIASKERRKRA